MADDSESFNSAQFQTISKLRHGDELSASHSRLVSADTGSRNITAQHLVDIGSTILNNAHHELVHEMGMRAVVAGSRALLKGFLRIEGIIVPPHRESLKRLGEGLIEVRHFCNLCPRGSAAPWPRRLWSSATPACSAAPSAVPTRQTAPPRSQGARSVWRSCWLGRIAWSSDPARSREDRRFSCRLSFSACIMGISKNSSHKGSTESLRAEYVEIPLFYCPLDKISVMLYNTVIESLNTKPRNLSTYYFRISGS